MKRCTCSLHEGTNPLPISFFTKDASTSDSLSRLCRLCSQRRSAEIRNRRRKKQQTLTRERYKNDPMFRAKALASSRSYQRRRLAEDPMYAHKLEMWRNARSRAVRKGLTFTITVDDISIPQRCPILDLPLTRNQGRRGPTEESPTLDRIDPKHGYVPGNVIVISMRANTIKSFGTPEEHFKIYRFLSQLTQR